MGLDTSRISGVWTRRQFLRGAAAIVAAPDLQMRSPAFAFIASGKGAIHAYAISGNHWTLLQTVPSLAPSCVLLDEAGSSLYVANEIDEHEGLARGTVEAFHVDIDGRLTLVGRRPLSLSATRPRQMAISPDGKLLAVAAYGGGIYNLLPIAQDGGLGAPSAILKEAGCGTHPDLQASAHPHTVCFDPSGRYLLGSDLGKDALNVFAVANGELARQSQSLTGEGSGPGAYVLHPGGSFVYALHELEEKLAVYRVDGAVIEPKQLLSLKSPTRAIAMHPSGKKLYTGHPGGLQVWNVGAALSTSKSVSMSAVSQITAVADALYVCNGARGSISRIEADSLTGELHGKARVAFVDAPRSIALQMSS